jgi:hypothetical protein
MGALLPNGTEMNSAGTVRTDFPSTVTFICPVSGFTSLLHCSTTEQPVCPRKLQPPSPFSRNGWGALKIHPSSVQITGEFSILAFMFYSHENIICFGGLQLRPIPAADFCHRLDFDEQVRVDQ